MTFHDIRLQDNTDDQRLYSKELKNDPKLWGKQTQTEASEIKNAF